MNDSNQPGPDYSYFKKVLIFVLLAAFIILLALLIRQVITVLLLVFAGILFGILLRVLRDLLHTRTGLSKGVSLISVIILFCMVSVGSAYLLAPPVYRQAHKFYRDIPQKWEMIKSEISVYQWGRELANENPHFRDVFEDESDNAGEDYDMTKFAMGLLYDTAAFFAALLLILVTGIYIAYEPSLYSNGFLRLFPKNRRQHVADIMNEISLSVQWWLAGQLSAMLLIGVITSLGLWLIGMPYALLFGLFAALMNFIPNLGPVIAAVPTILIALTESIELAIYVAILFTVIQCIEGYFITPLIHRRAIQVPPVLIIATQFLLFYLIGFLGILLAMPLLASAMVIIKKVYIEGVLDDSMDEVISPSPKSKSIFDREK